MANNIVIGHQTWDNKPRPIIEVGYGLMDREVFTDISNNVAQLLDDNDQIQLANKYLEINRLFQELQKEIKRLRDREWYNYFLISYTRKLSKWIKYAQHYAENTLLMDWRKLPKIINQLLSQYPTDIQPLIKQAIFDDYLIDLAFELMSDEIDFNLPTWSVEYRTFSSPHIGNTSKRDILDNSNADIIDFLVPLSIYTNSLWNEELKVYFSSFKNTFLVNMSHNSLHTLETEQIETIFSWIKNIPYKLIQGNNFNEFDSTSLIALFRNLWYSRFIWFSGNQFFNLPDSTIIKILPYLRNVTRIKFSCDRFNSKRQKQIRELLPNTELYFD